jgi:hypothetical protein
MLLKMPGSTLAKVPCMKQPHVFFCEDASASKLLREVATFRQDTRVRKYAYDLQDQQLLAKLSAGDMIAHPRCLVSLYNKAAALQTETERNKIDKVSHGIALAELLAYIDESRIDEDVALIFKLSDLVKLYSSRTELKNYILALLKLTEKDVMYCLLLMKTWGLGLC